jgi:P-type Cu2+ transporter
VWVAVAVLIVTCPCALSLAAPSALLAAASALARRGVLLQRLDALEALTRVQRVYLDKTGTVTDEQLACTGLQRPADVAAPGAGLSDQALWQCAAGLAGWSSHPVSRAVVAAARDQGVAAGALDWHQVQELPGQGVQALDDQGRTWRLGHAAWAVADGPDRNPGGDAGAAWLSVDGQAVACWRFEEALRPDAAEAVAGLRALGLQVALLSGDQPARASRMGALLQVDQVLGGATPESKLAEVAAAQTAGLVVAMVGDGINDAPVLARADVSFAMGQGALVARAQADAVITSNRLADLLLAHRLARRTMRVVRQNLAWAAGYNAVCIPLAMVGWLPPWAAGLGMALSSLLVVGNAARLAR